jgi:hypothetical protein
VNFVCNARSRACHNHGVSIGQALGEGGPIFLQDSLEHGMSFGKVAGFLRRTEDEVREKAKELNYRERATLRSSIGGRRSAPNALPKSQTRLSG